MKALEDKILKSGTVIDNRILKVDNFFNYQIDTHALREVGKFIADHFKNVDKVLTVEASGIAFAIAVAYELGNVPIVFAKKSASTLTINDDNYFWLIHSFTHNNDTNIFVRKEFLSPNERILVMDDFLATGNAAIGLINICKQANAKVVGVGAGIEKEFQGGRKKIEDLHIPVVSAARIVAFKDNKPVFSKEEC